jgi:hypothetical protein
MRRLKTITLLLVLVPALVAVHAKPKRPDTLPAVFQNAKYVYVQAVDGDQFDPRLNPDDRQAIANVQSALSDWKRYALVIRRDQADLIIVVRKGRLAEGRVGVGVGTRTQGTPNSRPGGQVPGAGGTDVGVGIGGEVGSPDDLFVVYESSPNDALGIQLWMRMQADGLSGKNPILFKQLKDAVEKAYPTQQPSQTKKP